MSEAVLTQSAENTNEVVMLTVPQVAKRLLRGCNTIRRWIEQGAFPNAERYRGSWTKIPESDVVAFKAQLKTKVVRRRAA